MLLRYADNGHTLHKLSLMIDSCSGHSVSCDYMTLVAARTSCMVIQQGRLVPRHWRSNVSAIVRSCVRYSIIFLLVWQSTYLRKRDRTSKMVIM